MRFARRWAACEPAGEAAGESGVPGIWQTEGYGHFVEVSDTLATFYEVTSLSCIANWEMVIAPAETDDSEATLLFDEARFRFDLQPGADSDERWLRLAGLASRRRLQRVERLPPTCNADTPSDPVTVFDVFWQTYAEHYPFFEMKGVDWGSVRERERPGVTATTTAEELFEVLRRMIEPLEDAHTFLSADDIGRGFGGRRPDPNPLSDDAVARAVEIVTGNYLVDGIDMRCNDQMGIGRLDGDVRYMALGSFSGFGDDFESGLDCLNETLDTLLDDTEPFAGVVLDVRVNTGGMDPYGLAIASRFATRPYLAYTKQTRNDPADPDSWSAGQPSIVTPSGGPTFHGPVALLTGQRSVSAAETFTMALMGREPAVTRVGQNTQGVFSDVLGRLLPNGWSFGLPNERFLTEDGRSFDGPGIPPDVEVPVFSPGDRAAGVDAALDEALRVLSAGVS